MTTQTCIKYLLFVSHECERHLRDGKVTDEELISLIVEMKRFQEKVQNSELPEAIKTKIADIKLNYSIKGVERTAWFRKFMMMTFRNSGGQGIRISVLDDIRYTTQQLAQHIQVNY